MQRNIHDEVYWSKAQQKKYLRKESHSERRDTMIRNIMKILYMVPMRNIMKVLYVAFCVFISAFFLGLLVYAGWGATPLSGSTMPVLAYIAVTALVLTGVIIALALAVVGMIVLYRYIFRLVIDGKNSPK